MQIAQLEQEQAALKQLLGLVQQPVIDKGEQYSIDLQIRLPGCEKVKLCTWAYAHGKLWVHRYCEEATDQARCVNMHCTGICDLGSKCCSGDKVLSVTGQMYSREMSEGLLLNSLARPAAIQQPKLIRNNIISRAIFSLKTVACCCDWALVRVRCALL